MTDPARIGGSSGWRSNPLNTSGNWHTSALHGTGAAGARATTGPTGSLGGHTVQQQATADAPGQRSGIGASVAKFFKQTLPDFFKDVGTAFRNLFRPAPAAAAAPTAAVTPPAPRTFDENRTELLSMLPPGIQIDDQGVISGQYALPGWPQSDSVNGGKTVAQWFSDMGTSQIAPKLDEQGNDTRPVFSGIPIGSQGTKDIWRMDFTIGSGTGAYQTLRDPDTDDDRVTNCIDAVKTLTNDDATATVLSGLMNQQFSQPFFDSWQKADGSATAFQPVQRGNVQFRDPSGTEASVPAGGLGKAKIEVTALPNGNYKISIDSPMHFSHVGRGFGKSEMPGMGGSTIKGVAHADLIIDGTAAAQGRCVVTTPAPATVTFSGRMAPPT